MPFDKSEWQRQHRKKFPSRARDALQDWRTRNPDKITAQNKKDRKKKRAALQVWRAVQAGNLVKLSCQVCGGESVEAHHPDYDKPLDIIWLCKYHHEEIHHETT